MTPRIQNVPRARSLNIVDHVFTTDRSEKPTWCNLRRTLVQQLVPACLWKNLMKLLPLLTMNTGVHCKEMKFGRLSILPYQTQGLFSIFRPYLFPQSRKTTETWSCKHWIPPADFGYLYEAAELFSFRTTWFMGTVMPQQKPKPLSWVTFLEQPSTRFSCIMQNSLADTYTNSREWNSLCGDRRGC